MHSYHIIPLFAFTGLAHSWGGLSASSLDVYCFYSIYESLSTLTWSGSYSQNAACNNPAQVKSIYTSAKLYCSEEELSAGVNLWEDYCQGLSSPLNLDAISNNTTSSYLAELPHVDPSQYNRTILTSTVLLSHSYYLVAFHSYLAKDQALPKSTRLSWSVMGYWGVILLMGTLHLETWSASENNSYQTKLEYAYIAVPAALGSYHRRRFLGCSIPNRPEILVVVGFWIMCIILNFGFHDIFIPNATMPTISQQAWKYVAQRTSTFAYACLPWVWLFAGRNNIFIWATGWSFNTFNAFHRHLSRLTAIFAFVHAISYTVLDTIYGRDFEICLKHTSVFGTKYNAYLWPVVAIWCFDRFLRIVRLAYCNIRVSTKGHVQTTTAMATYCKDADVIRLDIQAGGSIRPLPGHYFHLYQLFSWRGWENHPFTVGACTAPNTTSPLTSSSEAPERCLHRRPPDVTTDPTLGNLVFWIRPYNGWTKRLKNQCLGSSSSDDSADNGYYQTSIPIALEGPYGHTIPLYHYGSVLMVVGGTGIATAVPYIQDHVSRSPKTGYRRSDDNKTQTSNLTLVWACRGHEFMEQLRGRELAGALKLEGFTGRFYCTKGCDSHCAAADNDGGLRIERGRPNIENIIHGAATEAQIVKHRMAVLTCGSPIMSDEVRRSVHSILKKGYEGIEYFEEAYSW
ncbi:hypothetical protein BDV27DRAFT_142348 [Aspergillus caelatus]|uniref:Ferric reductase like transmembrane component-domain-containing protein n=1 Tax=Aspergillus caelatus TaxID=61420 RepID=A0A5N7AE16_9EURO|nr:uncharacterized protein BDV27DRAFT_142348 [Aspergillus caelatus]KAE8367955.1 hypothetical protein BDV27DRAFT_142348 [Aspergillus caelatus]